MAASASVIKLNCEKYRLANGLEVILLQDHRLPLVAVNVWYHVGPANERPGLTGFAHLFEHMMFEGSKHVGAKAHFQYLEAAGASDINGTTDFDRTNYFETLPSNRLELALWLESDRMGFLLDTLDDAMLENQRDIVRNERRQSIESAPYGLVQEDLFHQLYPREHPYYASVIGSHADIEGAQLSDVREFFRLYYAPNNASLAIVGDIDVARARALVEKYFGPIPSGPKTPAVEVATPPITSERRSIVGDQVELPRVYMAWHTDAIFTQGDAECDLAARIIGGSKASRLYKSLVYEKRLAQDVSAEQYSLALGSIFTIEATAKPGVKPEDLEKCIDEELEELRKKGPTATELKGARNTIETAIIRGLETLGGFGGVADRLNQYNHFLGDPESFARDLERYRHATRASLRAIVRKRLNRNTRAVVYGVPGQKVIRDVPKMEHPPSPPLPPDSHPQDQEWRRQPPPPGPASPINLPVPQLFKLANGLTILLVQQHKLPIVSANMIALSGSDRNPKDRPGLASFTAEMLDEGTSKRSSLEIAINADHLGASFSTGSSVDLSYLALRVLKKNVDAAFELASDLLLNASFPAEEIERLRHDRLTHILQQRDNPNILGTKVFFDVIYGASHPYGHMEVGTEESNQAIGRDELIRFRQAGYFPANMALVVAGDIAPRRLCNLCEKYLGGWRQQGDSLIIPAVDNPPRRRIVIVEKPESMQTTLRIGHVSVARANPDCVAIDVMNTMLGGLFSSRININLREKHGFTYGASSTFAFRRGPGPFLIGTSVRADVTARAVTEIFREIDRMRESEPTPAELALAKDSMSRSLPSMFETTPQATWSVGQLFVHGLPIDYYRALPDMIEGVSATGVRSVAEKHLKPKEMVVIAVGERTRIERELEKLDLGPIEIRDSRGESIR